MEVKIIGSNTKDGIILRKRVLEAAMEIDDKVTIILLNDDNYLVKKKPSLVIDNDITIEGRLATNRELVKIFKSKVTKK